MVEYQTVQLMHKAKHNKLPGNIQQLFSIEKYIIIYFQKNQE